MLLNQLLLISFKKKEKGFTLIELLVVVTIIGILMALAVPNFLSQTAKAKQTEAKTTIGTFNRAQVAFRNEGKGFAKDFDVLAVTMPNSKTSFYTYDMSVSPDGTATYATATPKDTALKSYTGGVVEFVNKGNSPAISTVMCEAVTPGINKPSPPVLQSGANTQEVAAVCGEGQNQL